MPEMICPSCGGTGQVQVQKFTEVTNPDGSKSYISSTEVQRCSGCGGTGKKQY
ncbi:hypothetical protein [Kitasatospora sp. NPDC093558]|uniref:hypothetical protein n=1 Tax=Kitasatospora sp. NPDC093558 TaxID=3155201 RepID=UPI003423EEEB